MLYFMNILNAVTPFRRWLFGYLNFLMLVFGVGKFFAYYTSGLSLLLCIRLLSQFEVCVAFIRRPRASQHTDQTRIHRIKCTCKQQGESDTGWVEKQPRLVGQAFASPSRGEGDSPAECLWVCTTSAPKTANSYPTTIQQNTQFTCC